MLRNRADIRTLGAVAVYFALAFGGYFTLHRQPWWLTLVWVAATMVSSFQTAVITHNTIHTPVFTTRWMNRAFQLVLTLAYGHPVSAFVAGHNYSHHLHPQTRMDAIRTTKARFQWNLLNQLFFVLLVAPSVTKGQKEYVAAVKDAKPRWYAQYRLETWVFNLSQLALLIYDWRAFLVFILVPHLFAVWGILGINFVQHDGCDPDHPYNHSRNLTGPWMNWLFFNNGYHAMHHEIAGMHWSELPAAHAERIAPFNHDNLDQPNFIAYCWRAYIWPGKRVDYLGNPVILPEEGPDERWAPQPEAIPASVSFGAEG